ncbi:undecaprenyl-phosphate glucose phosphotransferase [Pedobacter cryophilus]|uniref:Undecaprenyl-phosphate glucose phosphotransferase n=1 Tax=Pedobacter cryophilus TaxID=2571271 RepID=A0A4U1C4Y3_9SPHI|nr:undecaprenyl-phosphate glucose phosphotransferase [Pedobacter cryophilus]TKC00463.1 undecaprenyl-phosphate glucose phosphotransferase [Pedobacter cryophilus]
MSLIKHKVYTIRFIADIICLILSYLITFTLIRVKLNSFYFTLLDLGFLLYLISTWYFTSKSNQLYDESRNRKAFAIELLKSFNSIFFQAIASGLFLFTINYELYGRTFVIIYISSLLFIIPSTKILLKRGTLYLRKRGQNLRSIIIIGAGKTGLDFYKTIKLNPNFGYEVIGFLDDQSKKYISAEYLGNINQLENVIKTYPNLNEIVIALPNYAHEKVFEIVKKANNGGVRVKLIPDYNYILSNRYTIDIFGGQPVITLRHEPLEAPHLRFVKRSFDIVFSVLLILLVFPWLFLIIATLIKIDSKGPVFFLQKRLGKDKIPFFCFKFRTMKTNNTSDTFQAVKKDNRVTKVGEFLRKTSLDELPQFLNVLLGEMSVVGPRPHMILHNEEYSKLISSYMVRQLIKPGITGWAQVNGYRGETKHINDMKKRVEYDVFYLENWSLSLDLKIIFLTVWNVLKGEENAY